MKFLFWITLMGESKEELKNIKRNFTLLMRVKEESESISLRLNVKKLRSWHLAGPITAWQVEGAKLEAVTDFLFLDSRITVDGDCNHEIRR